MKRKILIIFWIISIILGFCNPAQSGLLKLLGKGAKLYLKSRKLKKVVSLIEKYSLKNGRLINKELKLVPVFTKKGRALMKLEEYSLKYGTRITKYEKIKILKFLKIARGIEEELLKRYGRKIIEKGIKRNEAIKLAGASRVLKNEKLISLSEQALVKQNRKNFSHRFKDRLKNILKDFKNTWNNPEVRESMLDFQLEVGDIIFK